MSDLTYERISSHFHLPINEASKELSVCATILKKVCRSLGIKRWPHRKIRSLDNMISQLNDQLSDTVNPQEIARIKSEIANFEKTKEYIIENPNTSYKSVVPKSTLQSFSKSKTKNGSSNRFVVTPNSEELVLEVLTNLANHKEASQNAINNYHMNNDVNSNNNMNVNNSEAYSSTPSSPEYAHFSPNSPPKPPLKKLILQRRKLEEDFLSQPPLFSVDIPSHHDDVTKDSQLKTTDPTPIEKENALNSNIQIISFTHTQPLKKRKLEDEYEVPSLDEFRRYKSSFPNIKYQRIFEDSLVYISKNS